MSVLDIEAVEETRRVEPVPPSSPRAPQRPARGRGRAASPRLRPATALPAPTLTPSTARRERGHACQVTPPRTVRRSRRAPVDPRPSWRLTDRGIAAVLVTVAMVAVAALAVVVPTALRVTGENYQPYGTSQLANP